MADRKPICRGVRRIDSAFDTAPGEPVPTEPCQNAAVKRGLCITCYERVRAGGNVDSIALPWSRAKAQRKGKVTG